MEEMDRVPPNSIDAEKSTLGSMLLDRDAIAKVIEILKPKDFYREAHTIIFNAINRLFDKGEPVDLVTVSEELNETGHLEAVGGASYITSLVNSVPTAANVEHYAKIVEEKAILRRLIKTADQIAQLGYKGDQEIDNILDQSEQLVFNLSQRRTVQTFDGIKDILMDTFDNLEKLYNNKGDVTGIATGFRDLDKMTSGLQPSDLFILAARPSMGKTALALNIAQHAAVNEKKSVAIFSLEMSKSQLVQRMLCSEAQVDSHRLRTGFLNENDWRRISQGAGRLGESKIFIDDTPGITVMEMRAKARRIQAEHGLDLILIDYLQLMTGGSGSESRQQEVSDISRSLKGLARELSVPVVSLSQLSRAVEQRNDKRPQLSDLRSSGSIEQDADVVAFIYRDDYYNPDSERAGITEIIIGKQRNGPVGTVELAFQKEYTKFVDLSKREEK
ncbi:replicative DNA helicase [Orenia metallireducens]|uniref:Replicative DNA helicase n=1 Tax=Orenia metallireducens TaxID=1413210 RepID=A0A285G1Z9_9FIRM|nr:replicative DNA helicase [Orenia metallireducens]PRX31826.1 replicative DNA helicase [Orenia metallireducens]SNY17545.1 replicative DNA helicase [Orenia metallireducens]